MHFLVKSRRSFLRTLFFELYRFYAIKAKDIKPIPVTIHVNDDTNTFLLFLVDIKNLELVKELHVDLHELESI